MAAAGWPPPIATVANTGSHTWRVPNTPSANCILRVRDAANAALYDLSNKPFTISTQSAPALSVAPQRLDFGTLYENLFIVIHTSGGGTLTWNLTENPDKVWRETREAVAAGEQVWQWHGENRQGQAAASGLYFYEVAFRSADGTGGKQSGKMILMR